MAKFIVLCSQVVGGGDRPFRVQYAFDGERFDDRKRAISHGFTLGRSDDFNIGVLERGRLVSVDWMEKPVDTDPSIVQGIAEQVGLRGPQT